MVVIAKIGGKSSTRDSSYLIFGDSGSKSVDTGAVNCMSGVTEYFSILLCGVRMKICRCCIECRSEYTSRHETHASLV